MPPRDQKWPRAGLLAALVVGVALAGPAPADEHEQHHGGQRGHGGAGQGLFPSLMRLPELSQAERAELRRRAEARMAEGSAQMNRASDALAEAASRHDLAAMQRAAADLRDGLGRFESGLATVRALDEGQPPREIALRWFKRELDLSPSASAEDRRGVFGLSWFHFFVMVVLVGFAAAMLWMYFHKMRRAAQLLQALTGAPPAQADAAAQPPPDVQGVAVVPAATSEPAAPRRWAGKLRVARIFRETPDVKTFRLTNPLGGVLPFSHLPGQFLTLTVAPDDEPVRRSYTIASSPTQRDYAEITVKHEEPGLVSGFLHGRVKEGDLLDVSGPSGSFTFTGRECKCVLLIGGGVGITPLMSVLRYLTDRSWPGDIFLLYGCHSPQDIIFREELEYLQRRHPNLRVVFTVSDAAGTDWEGPTGRISKELIAASVPDVAARYVHLCGPVPLMEAVKKMLAELGVPAERVKTEAFGPALGKPEPARARAALPATAGAALPVVTFALSGKSAPLPPDRAILDVADEAGVEIDNSCRLGTCGTCRVKLLSGRVSMAVEDGLEPGDKENNVVLACQAKSTGDVKVEA